MSRKDEWLTIGGDSRRHINITKAKVRNLLESNRPQQDAHRLLHCLEESLPAVTFENFIELCLQRQERRRARLFGNPKSALSE